MADFPALGLEQGRRFGYGHRFTGGADFERYVSARIGGGGHLHVLLDKLLEARSGHRNLVSSRGDRLDIVSRGRSAASINYARRRVLDFNLSRRHNRASGIGN